MQKGLTIPNLIVIGSINMDIVTHVKKHPLPGETIHGLSTMYSPGGKGANQAVAAARMQGHIHMIGAVGDDPFAHVLLSSLQDNKINTKYVKTCRGNSGIAFITVNEAGENNIILSSGANNMVLPADIQHIASIIHSADAILLQNEIPWETTRYVIHVAYDKGIPVFYNPAPAHQIPVEVLPLIETLIINETEAEVITGITVDEDISLARKAMLQLIQSGVKQVIITLGAKGSLYMGSEEKIHHFPAYPVHVVDTTAAGDTFIAVFAIIYLESKYIMKSLQYATAAAAIAVSREGAQSSIPYRSEIEAFLKK